MESYKKLLLANKAWVRERTDMDPEFFTKNSETQSPEFLWIGCSDSRVPAEEITGASPGEIFVHRNIANIVVHTDFNVLSVLQYAVEVLKVKNIVVCGHYGCGGVRNSMFNKHLGLINKWLRHIKDVQHLHAAELKQIPDDMKRFERLVELNVLAQVEHIAQTSIVQRAWKNGSPLNIHGWVYDLQTGLLKEISKMTPGSYRSDIYEYDFS